MTCPTPPHPTPHSGSRSLCLSLLCCAIFLSSAVVAQKPASSGGGRRSRAAVSPPRHRQGPVSVDGDSRPVCIQIHGRNDAQSHRCGCFVRSVARFLPLVTYPLPLCSAHVSLRRSPPRVSRGLTRDRVASSSPTYLRAALDVVSHSPCIDAGICVPPPPCMPSRSVTTGQAHIRRHLGVLLPLPNIRAGSLWGADCLRQWLVLTPAPGRHCPEPAACDRGRLPCV
jgi:hypothetical protein